MHREDARHGWSEGLADHRVETSGEYHGKASQSDSVQVPLLKYAMYTLEHSRTFWKLQETNFAIHEDMIMPR